MSSAWSLSVEEVELVGTKPVVQRLGFAIQLKMYRLHGRFFETVREVPVETIEVIASMLGRPITDVLSYDWESLRPVRTRSQPAHRLRQEVGSMSRLIVPMLYGDRQFGLFDGKEASLCSAPKIAPNYCYGKYTEQYQYVTAIPSKSHGQLHARFNRRTPTDDNRQAPSAIPHLGDRIAKRKMQGIFACEILLRKRLVLQQGCAC